MSNPAATADHLAGLQRSATTCDALPAALIPADHDAAYAAQDALIEHLDGERVGYKIAATGPAAQQLLGVDAPLWGQIVGPMVHDSPCTVSVADFASTPIVEAEIGLVIGPDGLSAVEARPIIELAASRFTNMAAVGSACTIADNIAATAFAVGPSVALDSLGDLSQLTAVITVDGQEQARGTGKAVLGSPINALAWLCEELTARGRTLPPGSIISSGAVAIKRGMEAGQHIVADFGPLGQVQVSTTA